MLLPFLTYAYNLEYEERPDYQQLKFMLKKVLMDRDLVVENRFDWSLRHGEEFQKLDPNDKHSSMSSCNIDESE